MQKLRIIFNIKSLSFCLFSIVSLSVSLALFPTLVKYTSATPENSYIYTSSPENEQQNISLEDFDFLNAAAAGDQAQNTDIQNEEILNISNSAYSQNEGLCVCNVSTVKVLDHKTGEIFSMPLDEYAALCVLSEMPTSYDIEALKAQAVACRTLAVNKMQKSIPSHNGADICTNSAHCQSFISKEEILSRYKESGSRAYEIAKLASSQTSGIIMFYNSEPILAAFHASSGKSTASSSEIWGGKVEYLVPAESFEIYDENSGAISTKTFALSEFTKRLKRQGIDCSDISQKPEGEKFKTVLSPSGRVDRLIFENGEISGKAFQSAFSLRSTDFTIEFEDENVNITCYGYGHGVGLSQLGAQSLAKKGYDFYEILSHYYSGITFGFAI